MKKYFQFVSVSLFLSLFTNAQDTVKYKPVVFKIRAVQSTTTTGYLSAISDSALFISSTSVSFNPLTSFVTQDRQVDYENLREVYLSRKGSAVRGLVTGAVVGAVSGAIIGLASGDDYKKNDGGWCLFCMTTGQKVVGYGILFGTTGSLVGVVVGATARKKFIINGNRNRLQDIRNEVMRKIAKTQ